MSQADRAADILFERLQRRDAKRSGRPLGQRASTAPHPEERPAKVAKKEIPQEAAASAEPTAAAEPDSAQVAFSSAIRRPMDLDDLLREPGKPVPNLARIVKLGKETLKAWTDATQAAVPLPPSKGSSSSSGKKPLIDDLQGYITKNSDLVPIILVPCNKSAPINMMNAKSFLQDGKYEPLSEEKRILFESARPEKVMIPRTIQGKIWTFEVRDSFKDFRAKDWLRTVAVITYGNTWEFIDYPFESLVDIFTTIKGFYFYDAIKGIPEHIKGWAVQICPLSQPHLHHKFGEARDNFFATLEQTMLHERTKKFRSHASYKPDTQARFVVKQVL
eukprot:CAMPEP_0178449222 /NCGR_PEP_ID=MMETSP0689_2-20121128/42417_1 /TAXON_ID=160604 /ORGANISM="Amphidinium massartii, Strain CS-259" /LENGTH=331 /DNA_ID=CAMNT_0020074489 /DNA_START=14 /DNA_END=1009 /DNA_ORIENTATION=-